MDLPYYGEADMKMVMVRQGVWAARGFLLVDRGPVMNHGFEPRYIPAEKGLLDPFVRLLFWAGLLAAIWRWRETALWWVLFLGLTFSVQVMSGGTPDAARGLIVAPLMFLFVALGIETLLKLARWMNRKVHGSGHCHHVCAHGPRLCVRRNRCARLLRMDWLAGRPVCTGAGTGRRAVPDVEIDGAGSGAERTGEFRFPAMVRAAVCLWAVEDRKIVDFCHEVADGQSPACVQVPSISAAKRDEKRKFDLEKLNAALLQYRAAHGGFPYTGAVAQPICNVLGEDAGCVLSEFLSPLPREPAVGGCFGYVYASDGLSFTLYASLENEPAVKQDCVAATGLPPARYLYCLSFDYQAPPPPAPVLIP